MTHAENTAASPLPENDPAGTPLDGFDALFAEIIGDMQKPSTEDQIQRLKTVQARFRQEWLDSGILTKIGDETPLDMSDKPLSLKRVMYRRNDGIDITELYFRVDGTTSVTQGNTTSVNITYKDIPVAQSLNGLIAPMFGSRFDAEDAELVFRQAAELDGLKQDGVIPDLYGSFEGIKDLSKSISYAPPSPKN